MLLAEHMTTIVKSLATHSTEVYADLPNFPRNGTTIPVKYQSNQLGLAQRLTWC